MKIPEKNSDKNDGRKIIREEKPDSGQNLFFNQIPLSNSKNEIYRNYFSSSNSKSGCGTIILIIPIILIL
ncbi:glycosyltransferase, group 1 family protein [Leptospira ryugenii]|uniref:Glycosyltransferase, group 1 family protein n=1 Tax=Leptospira ryugenii TaxID=1917863 RepID=A0A2P2DXS0_9LEPT|nr:hypothetical protein [Leptospira ryugenii]GBF49423.1 glycosyltransferase, group 1 family protein [Leptospira ryugenii]